MFSALCLKQGREIFIPPAQPLGLAQKRAVQPTVLAPTDEKGMGWIRSRQAKGPFKTSDTECLAALHVPVDSFLDRQLIFRLRLIRAILQAADDPDRDFLLQAEEGLPVGIRHPLPRTPHVFEEQTKWPLDREPWESSLPGSLTMDQLATAWSSLGRSLRKR